MKKLVDFETDSWKAVQLQSPADTTVYAIFKKKEQHQPSLHGYYHSKLDALSGSYGGLPDLNEVMQLCSKIKHALKLLNDEKAS